MKLKYFTIALAAGALITVLGLHDIADAQRRRRWRPWRGRVWRRRIGGGHGGFSGGAHFGGGYIGGMGRGPGSMSFSHSGSNFRGYGVLHGPRFYGQSFHPGNGRIGSRSFSRTFGRGYASRYTRGVNRKATAKLQNETPASPRFRKAPSRQQT